MDSKPDSAVLPIRRPGLPIALGAALVSALACYFGTGLHPIWWLAWLAPLPLLLVAPRLSTRAAFGISWLVAILGALNLWHYLRHDLENPLLPCLAAIVLPSAIFGAAVLFFRRCILRGAPLQAALIFPSFWVTYEYLQAITSPHGTALNLAYSQMNFPTVLQVASLTGIWGITFCILLFPATLAALIASRNRTRQTRWLAASTALFFLTILGFGVWRLHQRERVNTVSVALLASDLPQNALPATEEDSMRLLHDYAAQIDLLAPQHPAAFVIPEKISVVRESYLQSADSLFSSAATRSGAVVVVGLVRRDSRGLWNEARIYSPQGGPALTYEKHHMLPPFESQFVVGTSLTSLHEPSGDWGITICKDMDFPALSRQYARQGTALLLVPAWDFDSDGWLHARMAILRGVEAGFSIARAPRHGILTVTDDRGRVLAELQTNSAPFAALLAVVPVVHHTTLYSKWGDWFARLCMVMFLTTLVTSRRKPVSTAP